MLTKNLRALERDGIVTRTVRPRAAVRIEHQLTTLVTTCLQPLTALRNRAVEHLGEVIETRNAHARNP